MNDKPVITKAGWVAIVIGLFIFYGFTNFLFFNLGRYSVLSQIPDPNVIKNQNAAAIKIIVDELMAQTQKADEQRLDSQVSEFESYFKQVSSLPQERIGEMFKSIGANEKIDLDLVYQALNGPQTALRADAARYLGTHGNKQSIPYLIAALSDESTHVGGAYLDAGMATTRYWANDSLKKLTGKDFGFVWNDPIEKRNAAIRRWKLWYLESIKE